MRRKDLRYGDEVIVPWGYIELRATVREIYGDHPNVKVVVNLTPELSGDVVCEPTTFVVPLSEVRKAA